MKVRFQADAAFKQTIVAASLRRAPQVDSERPLSRASIGSAKITSLERGA